MCNPSYMLILSDIKFFLIEKTGFSIGSSINRKLKGII
jgi:hypothetical protein